MVDVKRVVVSVVAVLSIFLQPGIRAQSTISSEADSCSQLEEGCEFEVVENERLRSLLESERQTMKTLENVSYSLAEEIQRLDLELENKQQEIETLENKSSSRAEEINQLNMELENKQQRIETLENVSNTKAEEIHRINLELEKKQQKIETMENERRRLLQRELKSATATFIGSFDDNRSHSGITKVEDKIYVISYYPSIIKVYEDLLGFRFIRDIAINGTSLPYDIVYSNKSRCVYISDPDQKCIWVMTTTGEHRLTKWLTNIFYIDTLSLSTEDHLLVLRRSESSTQNSLEIYSLNATLTRRLHLPQYIETPSHLVQTSAGNFIISHRLNTTGGLFVISQLTNDGQLINQFIPRNKSEELVMPYYLSLDSDNNRLFVDDYIRHQVILFDSIDLTWSRVLLSQEANRISNPWRLFYDASKKYLFVGQYLANVTVI